jgi:hypothetical protein
LAHNHGMDMGIATRDVEDLEHSIARDSRALRMLIAASVIVATVCPFFAITTTSSVAWGLLLLVPLLLVARHVFDRRRVLRNVLKIHTNWGSPLVAKERDLKAARLLFDHTHRDDGSNDQVDEQTWKDLNMDQVYMKVDRTYADPGEAVLYRMLRTPVFDRDTLASRSRVIHCFQSNVETRERVQLLLMHLGHQFVRNDLCDLLWKNELPNSRFGRLYSFMAVAALLAMLAPVVLWSASLFSLLDVWSRFAVQVVMIPVVIFIINLVIHYHVKRRKDVETVSFSYLVRCIKTAGALAFVDCDELKAYTSKLAELACAVRRIPGRARFLFPTDQSFSDPAIAFILEYLNIFFLLEIRAFYATARELSRHVEELRDMYGTIGELDALQSVASFRASLGTYAEPEFVDEGIHLEVGDARQPLLDSPVPVSISFDKNVTIITGSNMGGKSTFLRTIGNNVLLAETIATTVASHYQGSFFRILSSISRTDDLISGKSFYYVEAERVLRLIKSLNDGVPTLCLVDELLSGTNSTERLDASESIIHYVTGQNALTIVATHDVELSDRLDGECDFYHFTDNVDETGLKFDYLLKPGLATTRNAVALLRYLGYPKEITEGASKAT